MIDLKSLKSFDWRSLQKFASPQAASDLNEFLEKLPENVGKTMLIIAGVAWASAGAVGLFTTLQMQKFTQIKADLQEAQALQPIVPTIKDVPVSKEEVADVVEKMSKVYQGLDIKAAGTSIVIEAKDTTQFGEFREAIGHVQNGGSGWRVNVDNLCVGRECEKNALSATLKINKISVEKPAG